MENSNYKFAIGKRIHDFRIENKYTQQQFAELIDISVNFLSEIENGKKGMSQDTIYKICKHFHLSADYLLFGNPQDSLTTTSNYNTIISIANTLEPENLDVIIDYLYSLKKIKSLNL